MKHFTAAIGAALVIASAGGVSAQPYLVNTGAGTANSGLILDGDPQVLDWTQSWHAGLITLVDTSRITGLEAWMTVIDSGDLRVAIYDAASGLPRSSPALFSSTFSLSAGPKAWRGVEGLDWRLDAGSYWVNLEPAKTSTFRGALWMVPPAPLAHYAESIRGTTWDHDPAGRNGPDQWALRITGTVPEPSTWAMMLLGFAGAGVGIRRPHAARLA